MDFKVFLSSDALSDLERIVAYITLDNVVSAERMGNQLLDAALSLTTFLNEVAWSRSFGAQNCAKLFSALIASSIA